MSYLLEMFFFSPVERITEIFVACQQAAFGIHKNNTAISF
jgi:hypothetical protein